MSTITQEFLSFDSSPSSERFFLSQEQLPQREILIATQWQEIDVLQDMQDAWNHFIDSGQVWALLIGLVIGYMFRSFTSY